MKKIITSFLAVAILSIGISVSPIKIEPNYDPGLVGQVETTKDPGLVG